VEVVDVDLHRNERKPFERKEKTKNAPDDSGKVMFNEVYLSERF
jgi:hypothetical protein